jgi:hypothetical protein
MDNRELVYDGPEGKCWWDNEQFAFWLDRPSNRGYLRPEYLPPMATTDFVKAMIKFWSDKTREHETIIGGAHELDPDL